MNTSRRVYRKKRGKIKRKIIGVFLRFIIIFFVVAYAFYFFKGENNIEGPVTVIHLEDSESQADSESWVDSVFSFFDKKDWKLILVNGDNLMPDDYEIELQEVNNGHQVDKRIYPDLVDMINNAEKDGYYLKINSAYRDKKDQQRIFDKKMHEYIDKGLSLDVADQKTRETVGLPGTSEHETGLAVDFGVGKGSKSWDGLYEWLSQNSYKYGFILRYPQGKEKITGIQYEHWHYRYVGKEAAKEIFESGLCLEEYLEQN